MGKGGAKSHPFNCRFNSLRIRFMVVSYARNSRFRPSFMSNPFHQLQLQPFTDGHLHLCSGIISTLLRREFNRHGRFLKRLAEGVKGGIPQPSRLRQNGIDWMDEGDRENGLFGSDGKKMAYCSQFSQCPDSSQRTLTLNNDSGIEKSLDIRVLSQNDFCTPGVGGFPRRLRLVHGGVALAALRLTEGLHGELRRVWRNAAKAADRQLPLLLQAEGWIW